MTLLTFFTDPVFSMPTIGAMLMCLASSLVGVMVFLKKQSLVGEVLSHATYPGVVLGMVMFGSAPAVLIGAGMVSALALGAIRLLQNRLKVPADAALCFTLASFLGVGILLASRVQLTSALLYRQIQTFLYGQVVTMNATHVVVYGLLALIIILFVSLAFRMLIITTFDPLFAKTIGIPVRVLERITYALLILAVIIGIRSVGVVLMAAMLIAPPVAARWLTNRLSYLFLFSGLVGLFSGFIGTFLSVVGKGLPTGPMIVLTASGFALLSLLFAPKRGLLSRAIRIVRFRWQCSLENVLKACWKKGEYTPVTVFSRLIVIALQVQGWMRGKKLTLDGERRAASIVRLHRLWEVYLVTYVGASSDKVHVSAEEMEHIITPELEAEITTLLGDVKIDPHSQPIPPRGTF